MKLLFKLSLLMFLSVNCFAGSQVWRIVNATDVTQQTGFNTYIGMVDSEEIERVTNGNKSPTFLRISKLVVVDQSGGIKKVSEFPWIGGQFVTGDAIYVRTTNVLSVQSITKGFENKLEAMW